MKARTCHKCYAPIGRYPEWVGGWPYCAEHAAAKRAQAEDHGPGCDGPLNCVCDEDPTAGFLCEAFWRG